jgi:hypothetical protein
MDNKLENIWQKKNHDLILKAVDICKYLVFIIFLLIMFIIVGVVFLTLCWCYCT